MEHRWYPRQEIDSPVMVYQKEIGLIKATVKNISADGLLVDVGRFAMAKGIVVALTGATVTRVQGHLLQLKALIVHSNDSLAGLMFIGSRHDVAALLRNLEKFRGEDIYFSRDEMNNLLASGGLCREAAYAAR